MNDNVIILFVLFITGLLVFVVINAIIGALPSKGEVGEQDVIRHLTKYLASSKYKQFHDVTLRMPYGTTQIDHVVVSCYGVFCIETKNMTGWIFGNARDRHWTQKIFGDTYRFQNPLRQNKTHVDALKTVLRIPRSKIHSVVVFAGDADLMTEMPDNVLYLYELADYIKSFRTPVFSPMEARNICVALTARRLEPSWETDQEHLSNVRERTGSG